MLRQTARGILRKGFQAKAVIAISSNTLKSSTLKDSDFCNLEGRIITEMRNYTLATTTDPITTERNQIRLSCRFSSGPAYQSHVDVSKAYSGITNEKMEEFLTRQKLVYKLRANGQIVVKECPFCHKPHNNKVSNLWTLNLKENSGAFLCFRCGTHGSWYDFVRYILGDTINFDRPSSVAQTVQLPIFPNQTIGSQDPFNEQGMLRIKEEEELRAREEKTSLVVEDLQSSHQNLLEALSALKELEHTQADASKADPDTAGSGSTSNIDLQNLETLRYLISKSDTGSRHLSEETLKAFKIGIGSDIFKTENGEAVSIPTISFPLFRPTTRKSKAADECNILENQYHDCVRSKVRGAGKENKHFQRFKPSGGQIGFFGLNLLRPDCKIVVLTEGEFDAMAVFEATGLPAISLPNGASNLPTQLIAYLEKVERIYLWMDNDEAGQLNLESFANKLGLKRTYIVQTDLDRRIRDWSAPALKKLLQSYRRTWYVCDLSQIKFENIREAVKNRILKREVNSGVKSTFFPWFNRTLKGFRKGEFTVFTGPTGSGKTTFLSQLSLDFAKSGVPTLWCSFELKNEVLVSSMLNQFAGMDLLKEPHRFDYYADQFEKIPLYFQTYFGSTHVDDVVSMIDYAVYTHDISHVVIDNLQFMLSGQGRGIERFDLQDDVVSKLRKLATTLNIHVTLVIHPRKGEEGEDLTVSSIFGTAKSTQEADNVMILQQREKYRVIDVKKNRYDGEIGKSSLWFDKGCKRFEQITPKEIEELLNGAKLQEILDRKGRELRPDMLEIAESSQASADAAAASQGIKPHSVAYVQHSKSQGQMTNEDLMKMMKEKDEKRIQAMKGAEKSEYSSAFNRLEQIKVNHQKSSKPSEPQVTFSQTRFRPAAEDSSHEPESRLESKKAVEPQSQKIQDDPYEQMFGVKFEVGSQEMDYEKVRSGLNSSEKVESQSEKTDWEPERSGSSVGKGAVEDPKMSALLGMQGSSMARQQVTSMYEEGTVIVTYDQMVEELLDSGNKSKKEWATQSRKETESSVILSVEKSPRNAESARQQSGKKRSAPKSSFLTDMFSNLPSSGST